MIYSDYLVTKYTRNDSAVAPAERPALSDGSLAYVVITPEEIPLFGVSKERFELLP